MGEDRAIFIVERRSSLPDRFHLLSLSSGVAPGFETELVPSHSGPIWQRHTRAFPRHPSHHAMSWRRPKLPGGLQHPSPFRFSVSLSLHPKDSSDTQGPLPWESPGPNRVPPPRRPIFCLPRLKRLRRRRRKQAATWKERACGRGTSGPPALTRQSIDQGSLSGT